MPTDRLVRTVDELLVHTPIAPIFELAADVERWPTHLSHYRYVRFLDDASNAGWGGGGVRVVEMSANRPFGLIDWPTRWTSRMSVVDQQASPSPSVRFTHVAGVTKGMEVEWTFEPVRNGTLVRIVHVWNGPAWPLIGEMSAKHVIAPIFVHGIASRTLAGLARVAERSAKGAGAAHDSS
jgi:ribosome-associated toxin RatA of RatAB toxin-antitoxin module